MASNERPAPARVKSTTIRRTIPLRAHERADRASLRLLVLNPRPSTRGECPPVRPCPYSSCRHHLGSDITDSGSLKITFPAIDVAELAESCTLDVAQQGPQTNDRIGSLMNVSNQRVVQMLDGALGEMEAKLRALGIEERPEDLLRLLAAVAAAPAPSDSGATPRR